MDPLARFFEYAQAFEQTYADDDWNRLRPYFAPDATYEVRGGGADCKLHGPDAIFKGIRKSITNFDKKFAERIVQFDPATVKVEGDTLSAPWSVLYKQPGLPDMTLHGRSTATLKNGVITKLADDLLPDAAAMAWLGKHGGDFDPSYV